jgi:hypothetical protein
LQGIELRYALTMYLLQHGTTTVKDLIAAMQWMVSRSVRGPRNRCQMRCAGNGAAAGFVGWHADSTALDMSHAPLNTEFISVSWHSVAP